MSRDGFVHVLTEQSEDDVRVLFDTSQRAEIVERRPAVGSSGELRKRRRHQNRHAPLQRERLELANGERHVLVERPRALRERGERVDHDELDARQSVDQRATCSAA